MQLNDVVIRAEGLGKKYIISHEAQEKYTALRDVIGKKARGFFSKQTKTVKEEFWALNDVGFEIRCGEAIGIIGPNGAGKSTLLKLLSRITEPTTGRIEINGRVSSLLEVGTGFHPELTGRENVFLNGAILGMSRQEIKKKFDAIVDFSGVEKFLDTPVKRYSSGMYLRLAFSVAAHLEPEILIVDEVLAVGDSEFQKKCLGKMDEVSKNEGRTVLFVSHNLGAIQQLCSRSFFLDGGKIVFEGRVEKAISAYISRGRSMDTTKDLTQGKRAAPGKKATIRSLDVRLAGDKKGLEIKLIIVAAEAIDKTEIAVGINEPAGNRILTLHSRFMDQQFNLAKGTNELTCVVTGVLLKPGSYTMHIFLGNRYEALDYLDNPVAFELPESSVYPAGIVPDNTQGPLMADYTWTLNTAAHAGS